MREHSRRHTPCNRQRRDNLLSRPPSPPPSRLVIARGGERRCLISQAVPDIFVARRPFVELSVKTSEIATADRSAVLS